jgi:anaerobic magnesium-protoporphyrin IX monomethyl ester cyclase
MASYDVALVFPPLWYYPHVPTEVTSAQAYLRAHGLSVSALDLNIGAYDYFLSSRYLHKISIQLRYEWQLYNQAVNPTPDSQARLAELAKVMPSLLTVLDAVDDSKSLFRDPNRFFNVADHVHAKQILDDAWRLISTAHSPTVIDLTQFKTQYNEQSLPDCLEAAQHTPHNPYVGYIEECVLQQLLEGEPRCIGLIYVHPDQMIPLITLTVALRAAGYKGHITILGSLEDQVSFSRYVRADQHPHYEQLFVLIDSVIIYEAEQTLAALAQALCRGGEPGDIPNLVRWSDGKVVQPREIRAMDLNEMPTPDFTCLPLDLYPFPEPVFALLSSRGCYWDRCTFCAITTNQLSYRMRRVDLLVNDLAKLQRQHQVRWFHFRDMLMSPSYVRRFCQAILQHGLDIKWICRARFETAFTRELLALMSRAGCVQVWFGFESASQRILNLMDKGTDASITTRILADCAEMGVGVHLLAMHGFPGEIDEEAEQTVAFIEAHRDQIDSVSYTDFVLFSGTPVYTHPSEFAAHLPEQERQLLQYRFEHRSIEERQRNLARYESLRKRVNAAVPMPLLHVSHIPLYRERLGAGSWNLLPV